MSDEIGFDTEPEQTPPPRDAGRPGPSSTPPAAEELAGPVEPVTEAQVRGYLQIAGSMAEAAVGREPDHWSFTDEELELIAPGLTLYINRHPALQRAASQGEGGLMVYGLIGYATRNVSTELAHRDRARREAAREAAPEPPTPSPWERGPAERGPALEPEGTWPPEVAE